MIDGCQMFVIDGGWIEDVAGSCHATAGDKIYVLLGSPTPLILRSADGDHRLMGPCYVSGIMHGEVVRLHQRLTEDRLREVVLVYGLRDQNRRSLLRRLEVYQLAHTRLAWIKYNTLNLAVMVHQLTHLTAPQSIL